MKKSAAILLISIYAIATMGFSLKEFYCCGKLKKVTIVAVEQKDKCKVNSKAEGCCNKRSHYFKLKDNHVSAVNIEFTFAHFTGLNILSTCFQKSIFPSQKTVIAYRSNAPPFHRSVPVYIANCVYRI